MAQPSGLLGVLGPPSDRFCPIKLGKHLRKPADEKSPKKPSSSSHQQPTSVSPNAQDAQANSSWPRINVCAPSSRLPKPPIMGETSDKFCY